MKLNELWWNPWKIYVKAIEEQSLLYEGLIVSYSPQYMINQINRLTNNKAKISYNKNDPTVIGILLPYPFDQQMINQLLRHFDVGGWELATTNLIDNRQKQRGTYGPRRVAVADTKNRNQIPTLINDASPTSQLQMVLEAKFGYDVAQEVARNWEYVYHATPTNKVQKILKQGLTPKSGQKMAAHADRIYIALSEQDARMFTQMVDSPTPWTILRISTQFLKQPGVRLYTDPAFDGGYFTLSNINPVFIKPLTVKHKGGNENSRNITKE